MAWPNQSGILPRLGGLVLAGWVVSMASGLVAADHAGTRRIVFPNDPSVLDLKRDLGAKGDGIHNDTEALQRGIEASCGSGGNTRILFIPNGTYLVTNTLVVKSGIGPWVYGETRDGVVLRLIDGVTNTVANCAAVLRMHPNADKETSADYFMRCIRNLTVDVGQNPSVDGIRWYGNNTSILKDVRVRGAGAIGINAGFLGQNGPNLIQDVVVEGFETGIYSSWSWGGTISRATIRNCRKLGLHVNANSVAVEDLVVENTPQAVFNDYPNDWTWWGGVIALVGGKFSGGNPSLPAITNRNFLYARNVTASGFKQVLASSTPGGSIAGTNLAEYTSSPPLKLYPDAPDRSFQLPIKREPEIAWETDLSKWVCCNTNGVTFGDNTDDTAAIQRTIDYAAAKGATTVYFRGIGGGDPNCYNMNGEVRIHGSVRHIIGLGFGRIIAGPQGKFIIDDQSAPVVKLQHLQAFGGNPPIVENRSKNKTLFTESCDMKVVGAGAGDIFVTDCSCRVELRSPGQSLWARQLNPEGTDTIGLVRNHGGKLWVMGVKHEGAGVRFRTDNGGVTEVFGMFNYGPGIAPDDLRPMFEVDNAAFCAMGIREISFGNTYPVKLREIRAGEVKTVLGGGWIGWPMYTGWVPSETNGPTAPAQPLAQPAGANFLASAATHLNRGSFTWELPGNGAFTDSITLTAATTTPGASIRFTTDGTEPRAESALWPAQLLLTNTTTLKLKAFLAKLAPSATFTSVVTRLAPHQAVSPAIQTNGLTYGYYEVPPDTARLPDFAKMTPAKTGTVAVPDLSPRQRQDQIAFRFSGYFTAPATGIYSFYLNSDDGSRLVIGDTLVIDHDGLHGNQEKAGLIALQKGQHPITVSYFNATAGSSLALSYEGPDISKRPVPAAAFESPKTSP
jgi:hypothetical protein